MCREKLAMRWLRSILSIVVLSLLLSSLLGVYMLRVLEQNVLQANTDVISYVQRNIDSKLLQLYDYSNIVGITKDNIYLKNLDSPVEDVPQEAYSLSESMRNYIVTNPLAQGVYVYYPRADLVVGNMGCFSAMSYYALQEVPSRSGDEQWRDALLRKQDASFMLLQMPTEQRLCYVRPTQVMGEVVAVMVIEVDRDKMLQEFAQTTAVPESALAVLLSGQTVASTGNSKLLDEVPKLHEKWKSSGKPHVKADGTIGFFHQSDLSGLEYVNVSSSSAVLRTVRITLMVCLVGAAGCLLFGVAASVFISRKNTRPMKKLLRQLGADEITGQDEYQFITEKFQQITAEHRKNQERVQRHQMLLNSMFLNAVLRGGMYSENAVFAVAKRYEVAFDHPCYQMLVLSGIGQSITDGGSEQEQIMKDLELMGYEALVSVYNGRYVILLNTEEALSEGEKEKVAGILLDHIFHNMPAHAGIGPGYDSMVDILTSYNYAVLALKQNHASDAHPIGHYTEALVRTDTGDPSIMQAFAHHIYTKEFGQAQKLLERLYSEYLRAGGSTGQEMMRQNAVDCLLSDALRQVLPPEQAEQEIATLMIAGAPDQRRHQTDRALQVLIRQTSAEKKEKTPVAVRAKKIIDENFTDPMMGLYMISEQLSISNSYLSTSFKNTYGVSIISYINRMRVDRAKQLILNTDKSIKEIALEVGFSSDINFIRVFKKLENLTPSTLRKEKAQ